MKTVMTKFFEYLDDFGLGINEENKAKFLSEEKQQIIDAQNYSQRGVHGEIYYNMVYGDTTNKENLK